jgi:DNA-binding MarR family transcriptional regulator
VLAVLNGRLLAEPAPQLIGLAGSLTSMLVLPYLGSATARRELQRPLAERQPRGARDGNGTAHRLRTFPVRLTHRTARTLLAIRARPGSNNRVVSLAAGIVDQGQCSKLLRRLERAGLIENDGAIRPGTPNAWRLTERGEAAAAFVQEAAGIDAPC